MISHSRHEYPSLGRLVGKAPGTRRDLILADFPDWTMEGLCTWEILILMDKNISADGIHLPSCFHITHCARSDNPDLPIQENMNNFPPTHLNRTGSEFLSPPRVGLGRLHQFLYAFQSLGPRTSVANSQVLH